MRGNGIAPVTRLRPRGEHQSRHGQVAASDRPGTEGKPNTGNSTHERVKLRDNEGMTQEFLSLQGVADRLGVSRNSVANYRLPEPDVRVGSGINAARGWSAATIDEWNANRPGPGNWGKRKPAEPKGTE